MWLVKPKEILEPVNDPTNNGTDRKTPESSYGTSKNDRMGLQTDPGYRGMPNLDHSFHVRDEIDLEPVFHLPGKKLLSKVHPPPRPSKSFTKRIQLSKVGPYTDLSRVDEGPSYGLPDSGSRQSEMIIQGSNVDPTLGPRLILV